MTEADERVTPAGLTAERLRSLLDSLDGAAFGRKDEENKRRNERLPYRSLGVLVESLDMQRLVQARFHVAARNLSAGGLSFVCRQALIPNQLVRLEIPLLDGKVMRLMARVTRCRYLKEMIHEVGVQFVEHNDGKANAQRKAQADPSSDAEAKSKTPAEPNADSDTPAEADENANTQPEAAENAEANADAGSQADAQAAPEAEAAPDAAKL